MFIGAFSSEQIIVRMFLFANGYNFLGQWVAL